MASSAEAGSAGKLAQVARGCPRRAETFEAWYHLWNMRDEDIAKLMDGVYKSGVLRPEAARPVTPGCARHRGYECPSLADIGQPSEMSALPRSGHLRVEIDVCFV
jgi:hypothetical protein